MKKRTLTPEQEKARDERRARFREIVKKVAALTPEERAAMAAKMPGLVTCEGHPLSLHNICLIFWQGGAHSTILGGFNQWKKQGRAVMKGQHGYMIWVPSSHKKENDSASSTPAPSFMENAEPDSDSSAPDLRFLTATIFDVSQTEELKAEKAA